MPSSDAHDLAISFMVLGNKGVQRRCIDFDAPGLPQLLFQILYSTVELRGFVFVRPGLLEYFQNELQLGCNLPTLLAFFELFHALGVLPQTFQNGS